MQKTELLPACRRHAISITPDKKISDFRSLGLGVCPSPSLRAGGTLQKLFSCHIEKKLYFCTRKPPEKVCRESAFSPYSVIVKLDTSQ